MSSRWVTCLIVMACTLQAGCDDGTERRSESSPAPSASRPREGKRVKITDNVYLEVLPSGRRVLVDAEVCLREGSLEQLLTRKNKKEHEALLAVDADARKIHEALLLAGAKDGTPVRWLPRYRAPTGTKIQINLTWQSRGKEVTVSARSLMRNRKSGKELDSDWVFAGSMLIDNPFDPNSPKHYLANDGDVICVANFESAMLDLPILSSKDDDARGYEAWTDRIPPLGTKVRLILEPVK